MMMSCRKFILRLKRSNVEEGRIFDEILRREKFVPDRTTGGTAVMVREIICEVHFGRYWRCRAYLKLGRPTCR